MNFNITTNNLNKLGMVVFRKISTQIATFCNKPNNDSPKSLYKYLIRACKKLPDGPKKHYQFMVKQSFKQHVNESDPERIKQIIQRSYEDADWILKKYLKK